MTWGELINKLETRKIYLKEGRPQPPPWDGNQSPCDYLESEDGKWFVPISIRSKEDGVTYTSLRNVCAIFNIPMEDFGIDSDGYEI